VYAMTQRSYGAMPTNIRHLLTAIAALWGFTGNADSRSHCAGQGRNSMIDEVTERTCRQSWPTDQNLLQ